MKKTGTRWTSSDYYQKAGNILELVELMKANKNGISLKDIRDRFDVSPATAMRMRNTVLRYFPQTKWCKGLDNEKHWYIPNEQNDRVRLVEEKPRASIIDEGYKKDTFISKLESLIDLAKKNGYDKLTDKQVMIAYYGMYTVKDESDKKTFNDIKRGLSMLKSPYREHIEFNE